MISVNTFFTMFYFSVQHNAFQSYGNCKIWPYGCSIITFPLTHGANLPQYNIFMIFLIENQTLGILPIILETETNSCFFFILIC